MSDGSNNRIGMAASKDGKGASKPKDTIVAKWELKSSENLEPSEMATIGDDLEMALADDKRQLVQAEDFIPGEGKYHAIVKLLLQFRKQQGHNDAWMMATGWLIRDDLVVTAGHCVFDHGTKEAPGLGCVTRIKAYVGYNGKINIFKNGSTQVRSGKSVAAPSEWLAEGGQKRFDVGFVQLSEPFDCVRPFRYENTDASGESLDLGVVGYPGDKCDERGEFGAQMYEMFRKVTYDLDGNKERMLEYEISTAKGNSGSPVLKRVGNRYVAIGTHVKNVLEKNRNAASVIGPLGVSYKHMGLTFKTEFPEVFEDENQEKLRVIPKVKYVKVPFSSLVPAISSSPGIPKSLEKEWAQALALESTEMFGFPITSILVPVAASLLHGAGDLVSSLGKSGSESSGQAKTAIAQDADVQDGGNQTADESEVEDGEESNHRRRDEPDDDMQKRTKVSRTVPKDTEIKKGNYTESQKSLSSAYSSEAALCAYRESFVDDKEWAPAIEKIVKKCLPEIRKGLQVLLPIIKDFGFKVALDVANGRLGLGEPDQAAKDEFASFLKVEEAHHKARDEADDQELGPFAIALLLPFATALGQLAVNQVKKRTGLEVAEVNNQPGEALKVVKMNGQTSVDEATTEDALDEDESLLDSLAARLAFGEACRDVVLYKAPRDVYSDDGAESIWTDAMRIGWSAVKKYGPQVAKELGKEAFKTLLEKHLGKSGESKPDEQANDPRASQNGAPVEGNADDVKGHAAATEASKGKRSTKAKSKQSLMNGTA